MSTSKRENPLLNIIINVVIPSVIMTKFSTPDYLGQTYGLILALLFPLAYGIIHFLRQKKFNFFSGLGLFSILLTGIIGLGGLDRNWMIVKETAVPLIFGLVVISAELMGKSLIRLFLDQILDLQKVARAFQEQNREQVLEKMFRLSSYLFGGTFFISAILNFILAVMVLKGDPGSVEFTQSLGRMTALSLPVITVPMIIITLPILWYLIRTIKKETRLELEALLKH